MSDTPELPHGTRDRYRQGCKCLPCLVASARSRAAYRRQGQGKAHHALVDAGPARAYLQHLQSKGVGCRQVAKLASLNSRLVREVRNGLLTHIRQATEAKLLAVQPKLAHGVRVQAWPIRRTLLALQGEGFSGAELSRRMGLGFNVSRLGLRSDEDSPDNRPVPQLVSVRTALAVRALYRQVNEGEDPAA